MKGARKNSNPKRGKQNFEKKDRVVDLFKSKKSKGEQDQFSFNKAPVLESSLFGTEKKNAKKKIRKASAPREKGTTHMEDYEGGSDEEYFQTKKTKFQDADDPFDEFEGGFFEASSKDFLEYFQTNQTNLKALNKMSSFVSPYYSYLIFLTNKFTIEIFSR